MKISLSARFGVATIFKPFSGAAAANLTLLCDELLLEHVGLPHVLDLTVHLVNWHLHGGMMSLDESRVILSHFYCEHCGTLDF